MISRNKLKITALIALSAVCAVLLFGACGNPDPSALPYLNDKIEIKGFEEDISVTVEELTKLETVSKKAEATRSNGDIVKITAVGPTLDTFIAKYGGGKEIADFSGVRFSSTDGYSISVPREILSRREVILAYMDGNEAFNKVSAPLRAVVMGERAMYWARMVNKIEFESGASDALTNKVVFFETALPILKGEFSDEEGGDIVSTIDMLSKYGGMSDGGKVFMSAFDGLKKNETIANFLKGFIKYTGDNIPQFCSPELPEGMNMNGIVSLRSDKVLYVSLDRGSEVWDAKEAAGKKGIGFSDIVKDQGFDRNGLFMISDKDGNTASFGEHDITKGVFAKEGDEWNFYLEGEEPIIGVLAVEVGKAGQ